MKRFVLPLAGIGLGLVGGGTASAASLDYCHRFATAHVKLASVQRLRNVSPETVHDQAFFLCLNMDDEPAMPTAYVDPKIKGVNPPWFASAPLATAAPKADQTSGETSAPPPIILDAAPRAQEGDASADEAAAAGSEAAQTSDQASIAAAKEPAKRAGRRRGSGLPPGSPELAAWCLKHFPNSYDAATGTIVPFETGVRTVCR